MIQLALLSMRRAMPAGFVITFLIILVLAATRTWGASPEVLAALGDEASRRAAARQGVWVLAAVLIAPVLVMRAASTLPRWREADAAWLAPRRASPRACLAATLGGLALAGLLLMVLALGATEIAAAGNASGRSYVREVEHESLRILAAESGGDCALADLSGGDVDSKAILLLRPALLGGPGAGMRAVVHAGDVEIGSVTAHLVGRRPLEVPLAPGAEGPLILTLERTGEGASLLLPKGSLQLLRGDGHERTGSLAVGARLLLTLLAMSALGLGLGAWMRGSVAAAFTLSLWVPAWTWGAGGGWWPGAEIFTSLALLGEGISPGWPGARMISGAAITGLVGLELARRGLWMGGQA